MMKINIADASILMKLLNRHKKHTDIGYEVDLGTTLKEILTWANKLVPSESGSIMLDDPIIKLDSKREGRLYFAACFGKGSDSLVGTSLPDKSGIFAETYRKRKPHISKDVNKDAKFYAKVDKKIGFRTYSIICAPIEIEGSTIGVIELINRKDRINYDRKDLVLLEIFAGYTATLIQNALIARNFEEMSIRDNLTGLYNDRYFFHFLEYAVGRALKNSGDVTIIFFDLDRFKEINDTHGHLAGSATLKEVSDIIKEIFSPTNAAASRYGGDEYVIVMPDTGIDEAAKYAERIRDNISRNVFLRKKGPGGLPSLKIKGVITCSIGVASLSESIMPEGTVREIAEALIKASDSAMYSAKEHGKNRVVIARGKKNKKLSTLT
jgi:diguanylate cyclase (GGDEF)-like protein